MPQVHLARGYTSADVRSRVRAGEWLRVRRGAYVDRPPEASGFALRQHVALARISALSRQLSTGFVFSHSSAALLWGLPSWDSNEVVHITQPGETRGPDRDLVRHVRRLRPDECTTVRGMPVTTLERTVVDCASTVPPRWGLALADAALRAGARRDVWWDLCDRMAGRRGVVTTRALLDLADDGAESPGESSTRFILLRAGFPRPETQVEIPTHLGTFWSDLGWPEWRLLGEYDGRVKYEAGGSSSRAVIAEKRRQDAVEETGLRVVRVTAEDLRDEAGLVRRFLRLAPPGTAARLEPRPALARRVRSAGRR